MGLERLIRLFPRHKVYFPSLAGRKENSFLIIRDEKQRYLVVEGEACGEFEGTPIDQNLRLCPLNSTNAAKIREYLPHLIPVPCNRNISFGFGDRLGIATPAHAQCAAGRNIFPVFAQQSVRENSRTKRTYQMVIDDATFGVLQAGYQGGWGADADHIKDIASLKEALYAGFSMFTIDLSDHLKNPDEMHPVELQSHFVKIPQAKEIEDHFRNREYRISGKKYCFTPKATRNVVVTFTEGLNFAAECYRILKETKAIFDLEISVDETATPTSPIQHIFIVEYLRKKNVRFTSIAPRFPGRLEKAIDYQGSILEFEKGLRQHLEICRYFGGYRLSIHSGSDKFALYPVIRKTCDAFHIKTAGTSWLQAVKTIAVKDPALYRKIHHCALEHRKEDREGYSVTLKTKNIPDIERLPDERLPDLFSLPESRQLIHLAYGSILTHFREEVFSALFLHEEEHYRQVEEHLHKHLDLLT